MSHLLIFFILVLNPLWAKEYYIKPKAFLDVESGKLIFNKLIKIHDKTIAAIEDPGKQDPKNIVTLNDTYLLPGFIDCHTHVLMTQTVEDQSFEKALQREMALDPEYRIKRSLTFLKDYVNAGFTSLCDLGNSGEFLDVKLKEAISEDFQYPSLYISGPGITTNRGQFERNVNLREVKKEYTIIDKSSDIDIILKKYIDKKIDILKIYLDNSPGEGNIEEALLQRIIQNKSLVKFKKITFHATNPESYKLAIKYKLKNLEHFYSYNLDPLLLKNLQFITPTDLDSETLKMFNFYHKVFHDSQKKRLRDLKKYNLKIVFGSDLYFHKSNALFDRGYYSKKSIINYLEAGFSSLEIIRSLTLNPALSLGEEKKIGIIQPFSIASMVGYKKNPLKNILYILDKPLVINQGEILK